MLASTDFRRQGNTRSELWPRAIWTQPPERGIHSPCGTACRATGGMNFALCSVFNGFERMTNDEARMTKECLNDEIRMNAIESTGFGFGQGCRVPSRPVQSGVGDYCC